MSLPYALCAIDLDDTLLGSDHRISPRSIQTLEAVRALGVIIILASGRMYETMLSFASELRLDTPMICYNGAIVRMPHHGETWLHQEVPADLADEIVAYADENHLQLNYYLGNRLYTAAYTPWMDLYAKRTGAPIEVLPDFSARLRGKSPTKLILVDAPEMVSALLPVMQERYKDRLYVTKSNDEYLEFLPLHADKGRALALVASRYDIAQARTIAIGDSWNDIPMVEWAGLGVAIGNAKPDLKAVADRIVGRSDEEGVSSFLCDVFQLQQPVTPPRQ